MIDIHNHILPNIDDGSISMEMSLEMLEHAANQGITDVVNTVHYQHPKVEGLDISYKRIIKQINLLQLELEKKSISIKIHPGAEVFYLPNLVELIKDPLATIGRGKYMLIEFHPYHLPKDHKKTLFNLKMAGVTPIIAHPERYKKVQKDLNKVLEWIDAGCLIQVDAGSLLGTLGKEAKRVSEKIIKNQWCQVLGSDAHDNKKRNFNLKDAFQIVEKWIGKDASSLVYKNPKAILEGRNIKVEPIIKGNKDKGSFWRKFIKTIRN